MREVSDFEHWYRVGHPRLLGSLSALCRDPELAAEATDEAFTKALAQWSRVSTMASPSGWTYRVALNALRRRQRRRRHELRLLERVQPTVHVESLADSLFVHADLWAAVAKLPRRQRTAIVLRYVADLAENDIAEAMGVSRGTVASTLSDARNALSQHLIDDDDSPATEATQ